MIINGYKLLDDFGFCIEEFLHQLILVRAEKLCWILIFLWLRGEREEGSLTSSQCGHLARWADQSQMCLIDLWY